MKSLVVGGTGPTGPYIVNGLLQRGYDVTIFHRGTHEIPEIPPQVEHIHGDPHFRKNIEDALAGRTFDLAVAMYGRIRFLAEELIGKIGRFIGVGGVVSYRGWMDPYALFPVGLKCSVPEDAPVVENEDEGRFAYQISQAENAVLELHPTAAHFRYPYVYGPYQLIPREWSVIRRILDKRPYIILPDGGLTLFTHGYAANLAHALLLSIDKPEASSGQIYNCGDETQLTLSQIVEIISKTMDYELEIVNMPLSIARPSIPYACIARCLDPAGAQATSHHRIMDLYKLKNQLGYKDLCPVEEAFAKTVQWYLEHQPERGGEIEGWLQDPFNYEAEDRLVAAYKESMQHLSNIHIDDEIDRRHPYPHPKEPGLVRDHRNR
jgi:nucleoside-diphosphate-sugar epimerase